ncbi:MAG: polysaccharide biosynthesis C-terminal domain-containing protein [Lachnospiraceae bacterium]|nr:polysaccharide biosynthesis C-terminal domain-containing protein [Candidatus Minthocola equi]
MKLGTRTDRAKINILTSLIYQAVALMCGLIVPRLLIGTYGSEVNGAVSSITTFLSYIVLMEAGIGALSRSVLYKALAEKNQEDLEGIVYETKSFFRKVAYVFAAYVLLLAAAFKWISNADALDFWVSFGLVIVIAISTFAEYFIGVTYSILIKADQQEYITLVLRAISIFLNMIVVVILVKAGCSILTVKLASGIVYGIRPVIIAIYTKKKYHLENIKPSGKKYLTQKKTALGQHIAWTLHNNTDVAVLTIFQNLALVSVYAVYNMITTKVQELVQAFTGTMEPIFGDYYSRGDKKALNKTFEYYETFVSLISVVLFTCVSILIAPFVTIYTRDISDVNYIYPTFGIILASASLIFNLRSPYNDLVVAAGHFRETRMAAYGEAAINIVLSIIFVFKYGLLGVAIGTAIATFYRMVFFAIYLSKNIIERPIGLFIKRCLVNGITYAALVIAGTKIVGGFAIDGYLTWIIAGAASCIGAAVITLAVNYVFYKDDVTEIIKRAFKKIR